MCTGIVLRVRSATSQVCGQFTFDTVRKYLLLPVPPVSHLYSYHLAQSDEILIIDAHELVFLKPMHLFDWVRINVQH